MERNSKISTLQNSPAPKASQQSQAIRRWFLTPHQISSIRGDSTSESHLCHDPLKLSETSSQKAQDAKIFLTTFFVLNPKSPKLRLWRKVVIAVVTRLKLIFTWSLPLCKNPQGLLFIWWMFTDGHQTLGIAFLWFTPQKVATRSSHPCPQPMRVQVRPVVSSGNFLGPGCVDPTVGQRTRPTCNTKSEAANEAKRGVAVWSAVGFEQIGGSDRAGPMMPWASCAWMKRKVLNRLFI